MNKWTVVLGVMIVALFLGGRAFAAEKMKVAVVVGGHGFEEKPFWEMFRSFTDLDCVPIVLKDDSEIFENIANSPYKVIVLYNMTQKISEKRQRNFIKLLDQGVGLVALHHSIGAFADWREYRKIIGVKYWLKDTVEDGVKYPRCQWKEGVDMNIHVEDAAHPMLAGIADFKVHDETYKGYKLEPGNHYLISCDNPGSQKQIGWTRTYGNAKVCYIQIGHGPTIFGTPQYRQIVAQAIKWAAKS